MQCRHLVLVALALAAPALAAPKPPAVARPAAIAKPLVAQRQAVSVAPAPAPFRLDRAVQARAYTLDLTLDPALPQYQGQVAIDLLLQQPQARLVLHAKGLRIGHAVAEAGAQRWPLRVQQIDDDRIGLKLAGAAEQRARNPAGRGPARPSSTNAPTAHLPSGPLRLSLSFVGRLDSQGSYGLFRQQEAGRWYAMSQFQAVGARQAFPLLDEPGWKVPWTVSLTVPDGLKAFSNTEAAAPTQAAAGWQRWQFATTPPLPSYLLALAVGPFDVLDAPPHGHTPLRFITPAGRADEARWAAGMTGRLLAWLEDYTGLPYPYAKLDSLALPVAPGFGAMEHPGLVTYESVALLARPGEESAAFQRLHLPLAAHELAHQWFGNLVTLAWWDDLWLNESFASWLGDKATAAVMPHWDGHLATQRARARAMRADRLANARSVQQPVEAPADLGNLWDAITYEKGQTVLAMAEHWLGQDRFRAALQRYLGRHAWGHASAQDFWAALDAEDARLPPALRGFVQQPGIPVLRLALACEPGQTPRLHIRQNRLLPVGSAARGQPGAGWQVPLVLRTPAGTQRLLVAGPEATLPLPDATCPAWLQPNDGGQGYYRVALPPALQAGLLASGTLDTAETMALLDDAIGLHEAGDTSTAQALALLPLGAGPQAPRAVVESATQLLLHLAPLYEGQPEGPAARARTWQQHFGARARALGWLPRPGDSDDTQLLRTRLLPLVADLGQDIPLQQQALALAQDVLAGRTALPPELRAAVLASAVQADHNNTLLTPLLAALRASTDRQLRDDLLRALGQSRTAAGAEAVQHLLLDQRQDLRETLWPLLKGQAEQAERQLPLLQFMAQHHAVLAARMGADEAAWWPQLFQRGCRAELAPALQAAFGAAAPHLLGGTLQLQRVQESVALCSAWRQHHGPAPAE